MVDVFISYKQEEREAVQIIASSLHDLKVSVWFDTKLRAGGSFDEEIAKALEEAKSVLVCWTPAAIQSEWVRGEATTGMQSNRLAACFLQPTTLIPPFNLTHAENLCAWAGQPDDPAWVKLLERIGELIGRPGLSTYHEVMRAGASLAEMKEWANANGADPLVDGVWARIALLEGEGASDRIAREKAEARAAGERRKAFAEKSRRLARERGLRDPAAERRRFLALVGSVVALGLISVGAIVYFVDAQARDRTLQDEANSVPAVRAFLAENSWHPISERAREKLARLDVDAWNAARTAGTIEALEAYLADARAAPEGAFVARAEEQLAAAQQIKRVQEVLYRLLIYRGTIDGGMNEATAIAIQTFRYRWNMPVSSEIDAALMERLAVALDIWIHPRLEDLRARTLDLASEADFIRLANEYAVEGAAFRAIAEVESGSLGGFAPDGRLIILFERHLFSRLTNHRYDATHPHISNPTPGGYPRTQAERWEQLAQAYALDPEAAFKSASYGRAQILGLNYQGFGFETAGEYVRFLAQSDANQLEAMLRFARVNGLIDELQRHDWAGFARRYNGPGYAQNLWDQKMAEAYARISAEMAAQYGSLLPGQQTRETPPPPAPAPQPQTVSAPTENYIDIPDTGGPDRRILFAGLIGLFIASLGGALAFVSFRRA
jgi:hypothetical protein